jgi:16S rRNA (cytidine1402-2'-O)-methyltransferase
MVVFEAPHRLLESLTDARSILGGTRLGAICREMTKTYEETIRGSLDQLVEWAASHEVLGEITLVFAGVEVGSAEKSNEQIVARVFQFEAAGMERKLAITTVAEEFELPKKLVYAAVVEAKNSN